MPVNRSLEIAQSMSAAGTEWTRGLGLGLGLGLGTSAIGPQTELPAPIGQFRNVPIADITNRYTRAVLGGSEFNDADQRKENENRQYNGLGDPEGWLRLRRSQRSESRDFDEALHDQNEDVKIERCNSSDHVDSAPCAYQVLFVQSKQRD